MADGPTTAQVTAWVHDDFDLVLDDVRRIDTGGDTSARVWRAGTAGGEVAVKWTGGGSVAGVAVPARLAASGVHGVAAPRVAADGRPWSERDGRRLTVVPWLDAPDGIATTPDERHWTAFGRLLAATHTLPVEAALQAHVPHHLDVDAATVRTARERHERLHRLAADHPDVDATAEQVLARWRQVTSDVELLLAAADALTPQLHDRPAVVCHGDAHVGNLLVGDGGQVWLIDWDDAVLAPPERDLLFVLDGVLPFAPVTDAQQTAFVAGYGPLDADPVGLTFQRCVRALEDLTELAHDAVDRSLDVAVRREAADLVDGVLSETGLVLPAVAAVRDLA